jgi:hypothetical protein
MAFLGRCMPKGANVRCTRCRTFWSVKLHFQECTLRGLGAAEMDHSEEAIPPSCLRADIDVDIRMRE